MKTGILLATTLAFTSLLNANTIDISMKKSLVKVISDTNALKKENNNTNKKLEDVLSQVEGLNETQTQNFDNIKLNQEELKLLEEGIGSNKKEFKKLSTNVSKNEKATKANKTEIDSIVKDIENLNKSVKSNTKDIEVISRDFLNRFIKLESRVTNISSKDGISEKELEKVEKALTKKMDELKKEFKESINEVKKEQKAKEKKTKEDTDKSSEELSLVKKEMENLKTLLATKASNKDLLELKNDFDEIPEGSDIDDKRFIDINKQLTGIRATQTKHTNEITATNTKVDNVVKEVDGKIQAYIDEEKLLLEKEIETLEVFKTRTLKEISKLEKEVDKLNKQPKNESMKEVQKAQEQENEKLDFALKEIEAVKKELETLKKLKNEPAPTAAPKSISKKEMFKTAIVKTPTFIRKGPGEEYFEIKKLKKNSSINVIEIFKTWAIVKNNGELGYVNLAHISFK